MSQLAERRGGVLVAVPETAGRRDGGTAGKRFVPADSPPRRLADARVERWLGHARRRPVYAAAALVLLTIVVVAIVGPLLPLPDPEAQALRSRLAPPMSETANGGFHFAGTDSLGRDVLSRVVEGARVTLLISLVTVVISGGVGSVLGLIAGYRGGLVDQAVMRLVDLQMAFPTMLVAIFMLFLIGSNLSNLVVLLAILGWTGFARIVRAQTLSLRNQVFVESALAIGCSHRRILFRHILPHLVPVIAVIAVFEFSGVMLAEASLSFLGLGVQPPDTSWGRMISEGQNFIGAGAWWLFVAPGLAIVLTVLSARLTSTWIQEISGRTA